jgi:hypothetical protein
VGQKCRLRAYWAGAIEEDSEDGKRGPPSAARRRAADVCLRGLAIVLANERPVDDWEKGPPGVPRVHYDGPPDDPWYPDMVRQRDELIAKREEWRLQGDLATGRMALTGKLLSLYAGGPEAGAELASLARRRLPSEPDAAERLVEIVMSMRGKGQTEPWSVEEALRMQRPPISEESAVRIAGKAAGKGPDSHPRTVRKWDRYIVTFPAPPAADGTAEERGVRATVNAYTGDVLEVVSDGQRPDTKHPPQGQEE